MAKNIIDLQREELSELMKMAAQLTSGRGTLPILKMVKIEAVVSCLNLECTDLDNHLTLRRTLADAPVAETPALCVSPRLLFHWLAFEHSERVTLVADPKGEMVVRAGSSILRLLALDGKEMPAAPKIEGDLVASVPEGSFHAALESVAGFVSHDETRYVLNGVHIFTRGGDLMIEATDGKVLARNWITVANEEAEGVMANSTVAILLKLLDKEGEDEVEIFIAEKSFAVRCARFDLVAKQIDGSYPNIDQVIPKGRAPKRRIEATVLQSLVRQVAILSNKHSAVSLEFAAEEVTARADAADVGSAEASAPITSEKGAEDLTCAFNAGYLALLGGVEGEEISMELTTSDAPALFRLGEKWMAVIMPMRTTA